LVINSDVLKVNAQFYEAFKDAEKMNNLWATDGLFCLHPGQEPLLDRDVIMDSWHDIIIKEQLNIAPANEKLLWFCDTVAVVVCEEIIDQKSTDEVMIASNLFIHHPTMKGVWLIAGHHSGRKAP
jgi:hypothetical protein